MKNLVTNLEISLRDDAISGKLAASIHTKGMLPQNGTELIILVHGFNNTLQDSSDNYKAFVNHFFHQRGSKSYPAMICPFYWPSNRRNAIASAASYAGQ